MTAPANKINFGRNVPWIGLNQHEQRRFARDTEVRPLAWRVYMAALGWANRDGHAEFARGELSDLLKVLNTKTGEVRPATKYALRDALTEAKRMGLIGPDSSTRCLTVHPTFAQKAKGGGGCKQHGLDPGGRPC